MSVPYTFATAATPLPLSELDANFATPITLGSTTMILGGTYTTISGLTLTSPTLNSPTINSPTINSPNFGTNFALGTPTSGNLSNCTGYTYANLGGTVPTWNQNTTGNAATASVAANANQITNAGGWNVTPTGTKIYFSYNGANVASLDSSGNFVALNNVTAYGTP